MQNCDNQKFITLPSPRLSKFFLLLALLSLQILGACASGKDIYPPLPTALATANVKLSNPISIAVDPANNQIILVNSNVTLFYAQGSIMTLSVDATNPNAPVLTATDLVAAPNFGGEIAFNGTNAFIPFREELDSNNNTNQLVNYTIGAGSITAPVTVATPPNPYGITFNGPNNLVVVDGGGPSNSGGMLSLFNTSLAAPTNINLTGASTANISDTNNQYLQSVAVDPKTQLAFITNQSGEIFVVDLNTNTLSYVLVGSLNSNGTLDTSGPINSRSIVSDGTYIYVVDGDPPALRVYNPALMPAATSTIQQVDESTILVNIMSLGPNPNGIAIDSANKRAYVANTDVLTNPNNNVTNESISVIDLTLMQEIARISLRKVDTGLTEGLAPFGIAVGVFNNVNLVFVADYSANTVEVINPNTLQVVLSYPQ